MPRRTRIRRHTNQERSLLCDSVKSLTLDVDVDPYYFYKLKEGYLLPYRKLEKGSKYKVFTLLVSSRRLVVYNIYKEGEEINKDSIVYGTFIITDLPYTDVSGAYMIASISDKPLKAKEYKMSYRDSELVIFHFLRFGYLAISSKLSSTTQSILEEQ